MRSRLWLATVLVVCGAFAAQAAASPTEAGPPKRPTPHKLPPSETSTGPNYGPPPDCEVVQPTEGPQWKPYKDRSIEEAQSYASQGLKLLIQSQDSDDPGARPTGGAITPFTSSMQKFFMSLAADPYNVLATYNLAAAYARISRNQCALNLLARLGAMAAFPSKKEAIEDATNRLLGRTGKWKDKADPDFDRLRDEPRFKEIAKQLTSVPK